MECERPDVCFFILLCLFQTLLELAVFLETVLLRHLALLLFSFDNTTLRTENLQFAVKHLVFTELAFQRTIIKGIFDAGFKPDLVETFLTIREHPGIVAFKLVLQSLTNHLISTQQVGC